MQKELDKVIELQKAMGYYDLCRKDKHFRMEYLRNIVLATHVELTEFLQEVPWKPWSRDRTMTALDKIKAAEELTDVLVFILVLWATLNPDVKIDEAMKMTFDKIKNRIIGENYGNHS